MRAASAVAMVAVALVAVLSLVLVAVDAAEPSAQCMTDLTELRYDRFNKSFEST